LLLRLGERGLALALPTSCAVGWWDERVSPPAPGAASVGCGGLWPQQPRGGWVPLPQTGSSKVWGQLFFHSEILTSSNLIAVTVLINYFFIIWKEHFVFWEGRRG